MGESPLPVGQGRKPVVGHTLSLLRSPLGSLERWGSTDDPIVRLDVAGRTVVLVTEPDAIREVLVTGTDEYRKAQIVRDRLGTLQGNSLVLLEGREWEQRRETLQSAFTHDRIASSRSIAARFTRETVATWPAGTTIGAVDFARDLSLAVLARVLFGLDVRGERTPIHEAAEDIMARMDLQSVSTYLPEWVPTPTNRRYRRAVATLHDRLDATVERAARQGSSQGDLLSTLVAAGVPPETIRDELIAFLFAGFDSTATALACTLGLLGDQPAIQADLRSDLQAVAGDESPKSDAAADCPLLDAVVRESLRLYPPQYVLFREPTTTVSLCGYRVAEGTTLVLPPWICHRDERFWRDPGTFRPRRWVDSDRATGEDRPRFAYFPYGGGPRRCLGARMANRILRTVVAEVCRRRHLDLVGELSVSAGPTLSVDGSIEVRVTE
jgi:cytochrome P450